MKLKADFVRSQGRFCAASVSGHAEYSEDDTEGLLLCTAVSSAVQLTCNTLTECFGVPESAVEVRESAGVQNQISVRLESPTEAQSEILHGLLIHLAELERENRKRLLVRVREL